jgi:hypothetical protein
MPDDSARTVAKPFAVSQDYRVWGVRYTFSLCGLVPFGETRV